MLAKPADGLPDRRRLAVRAQVGRLPRARLPRRRRDLHPEPRRSSRWTATSPSSRAAPGQRCRSAASSTARSSSSASAGLDFEALLLRIHPAASRVSMLAAQSPASFVAWDLLALGDEDLRDDAAGRAARAARAVAGRRRRRRSTSRPATRDRALAADWFHRFEGAGLDGVIAKRARRALPARQAGDDQGQAPAHGRLRGRRLPLAQGRPGTRSARCCSACTTTRARCTTSASPPRSRWSAQASSSTSWRR